MYLYSFDTIMELQDFVILTVSTFGFISVFKFSINFLKWVWVMLLRPSKNLKDYGEWAVITGSTDGIGKALAFDLASKGLNLVLVGRNPSKLEATSSEIHEKYGGQVGIKKVVIDLAKYSGEEIAHLMEEGIRGLDVGILVNNAGVSFPYARFFHEVDLELLDGIRKVNIEAATWITRSVLHSMLKKKKGAIVNIGSGSTMAGSSNPLYSVYAASKAYAIYLLSYKFLFLISSQRNSIIPTPYMILIMNSVTGTSQCFQDALLWSTSSMESMFSVRFSF